jgi:hypothetical protein
MYICTHTHKYKETHTRYSRQSTERTHFIFFYFFFRNTHKIQTPINRENTFYMHTCTYREHTLNTYMNIYIHLHVYIHTEIQRDTYKILTPINIENTSFDIHFSFFSDLEARHGRARNQSCPPLLVHTCVCVCVCVCVQHRRGHRHRQRYAHTNTHTHSHTRTYARKHTYTQHTHVYIHISMCPWYEGTRVRIIYTYRGVHIGNTFDKK